MEWYVAKNGGQIGPFTDAELHGLLDAGEISEETLVWNEALTDWQSLGAVHLEKTDEPMATCAVSGEERPQSELLQYGGEWVAPENKEVFLQGLREGVATKSENPAAGGYVFQNPRGRATLARLVMIGSTVASVLYTVIDFAIPDSAADEINSVDWLLGGIGLLMFIGFILSVVFFLMWTHRVAANAYALGGEWMEISPGWAVGWYFIPFANLLKPYRALKQTWQTTFQLEDVSPVMPAWWGFWLISNFLGNLSFRLAMRGETEASLGVDLISVIFEIGSLIAIVMIIDRITREQLSRAGE